MKLNFSSLTANLLIAFLLLAPNHSAAVAKPTGKDAKYAVVDMQAVILNVSDGKEARSKLEKEIKDKEKELVKAKEELDKMNKDWKTQAPLLSEAARLQKQQEFQEKFLNLRNEEMTFQNEIKKKEQEATQKIAIKVTELVNKLAADRAYEMVFETSSAGLLYLKDPADLTKEVIAAYEENAKKPEREKTAEKK